jgi:putative oxidoreductase
MEYEMDRVSKYWPETLSILRIVIGLMFFAHGSAKLFGFPQPPATGMPAMGTLFWFQGVIEVAGGALFALGLFNRPLAFFLAGDMAVAYFMAHAPKDFYPLINGGTLAIMFCFTCLFLSTAGAGPWSVDAAMKRG